METERSCSEKNYSEQKRDTFLISPDGTIVEVWCKAKVKGHAEAIRTSLMSSSGRG